MIKRPLCLVVLILLGIQIVLVGGLHIAKDLKPSYLEQAAKDGDFIRLRGRVYQREENTKYQTYYLTDVLVCHNEQIFKESNILVYIKTEESQTEKENIDRILIGNIIRTEGEVSFFQNEKNPGNFNQKFYYQKQGIHACIWVEEAEIISDEKSVLKELLACLRSKWKTMLVEKMGEYYGNIMSAIILGDKKELDADLKNLFQKCGIGHILAISGLHMSFIGVGFYKLLRKAGAGFISAGLTGIIFLTLYSIMIGGGVSSIRALVMFLIRIGADMTGRVYDLPTSLAVAAAVVVIGQPLYLLDAGFLLSFGAILGLTLINPILETFRIFPRFLCGGMAIQIITFPIILYFYYEVPLYSQILNLFIIPLMSVALGAGMLGSLLSIIWENGGTFILNICKFVLWIYEKGCKLSAELPFFRIVTGQPSIGLVVGYYLLLLGGIIELWMMKEKMKQDKNRSLIKTGKAGLVCIIMLLVVFSLLTIFSHGKKNEMQVVMLDVGQGDCIFIRTPSEQHLLIDGGSSDISSVGSYRIEPFLESQGVESLDYVFVSHGDTDHMSGIEELLINQKLGIQIQTLVLPPENVLDESLLELAKLAVEYGTRVSVMEVGDTIEDNGMRLKCLAPSSDYGGEIGNASSMVLDLSYEEFDMLFTGDLENEGEELLANSGLLRDYDILKVGHHGSKNSTSEEFLRQVRPEVALISAGEDNRYGHPAEETLERLEVVDCELYTTQECGAITIMTDGENVEIERYCNEDE